MDNEKLDLILEKLNRLDGIEKQLDRLEEQVDQLKEQTDEQRAEMHEIMLRIENEIVKNIQIIAEGHLDLSRDLHEAMKPSNTLEMVQVQLNMLQSKVRELERRIEEKQSA